MSARGPVLLSSRDNPLLVSLRRLLRDGGAYRRQGLLWLEGDHLCRAALSRGVPVMQALVSESGWRSAELQSLAAAAPKVAIVTDVLWKELSELGSPAPIGFVLEAPPARPLDPHASTVVLDRLQDAGNTGSILRSAAAFGVTQVLALKGTVALWSPKVLRAGMGAHFALSLLEGLEADALGALQVPLLATSSHAGALLHQAPLPSVAAWVFGHEGQGIAAELASRCAMTLSIAQPGGEESLNVAAAAAVCLHQQAITATPGAAQVPQKVR